MSKPLPTTTGGECLSQIQDMVGVKEGSSHGEGEDTSDTGMNINFGTTKPQQGEDAQVYCIGGSDPDAIKSGMEVQLAPYCKKEGGGGPIDLELFVVWPLPRDNVDGEVVDRIAEIYDVPASEVTIDVSDGSMDWNWEFDRNDPPGYNDPHGDPYNVPYTTSDLKTCNIRLEGLFGPLATYIIPD